MMGRLEQGLGILLILIILLDIFLTVLYARIGTSIIGSRVGRLVWASFVKASKVFGSRQGAVLSFCGPVILVLLVGIWALELTLGAALIMHPELGTSIRATNGETPTDFVTAMYAGGTSMAIVGASDRRRRRLDALRHQDRRAGRARRRRGPRSCGDRRGDHGLRARCDDARRRAHSARDDGP